jgi:transposase-like protein
MTPILDSKYYVITLTLHVAYAMLQVSETIMICPKCNRERDQYQYGRQVYCRDCWRVYNRERAKVRRAAKKDAQEAAYQIQVQALLGQAKADPGLSPNQQRRLPPVPEIGNE